MAVAALREQLPPAGGAVLSGAEHPAEHQPAGGSAGSRGLRCQGGPAWCCCHSGGEEVTALGDLAPQRDLTDQLLLLQDVHVIVEDALRRFSQDRTGLPDYALESGGQRSRCVFSSSECRAPCWHVSSCLLQVAASSAPAAQRPLRPRRLCSACSGSHCGISLSRLEL